MLTQPATSVPCAGHDTLPTRLAHDAKMVKMAKQFPEAGVAGQLRSTSAPPSCDLNGGFEERVERRVGVELHAPCDLGAGESS